MPTYQAKKSKLSRWDIWVSAPTGAVIFAVDCPLPDDCGSVRIHVPTGFCLVDVAAGTGQLLPLTRRVWKARREQVLRAELFCVAIALYQACAIRVPVDLCVDGAPMRVWADYRFTVEIGLPILLCQFCRGCDVVPYHYIREPDGTSVEQLLFEAVRNVTLTQLGTPDTAGQLRDVVSQTACAQASDVLERTLYNMGLTAKSGVELCWKLPESVAK